MKKLTSSLVALSLIFTNAYAQDVGPAAGDVEDVYDAEQPAEPDASELPVDSSVSDEPVGTAAADSATESTNNNKAWRRAGLIAAGVAVVILGIVAVNHNQGKPAH